jgi:hypothetical protein
MAVYKWRIPMLAAVQFNGKNYDEVKELIGDDSGEKEKFMLHTGEYEEPEAPAEPTPVEGEGEQPSGEAPAEPAEPPLTGEAPAEPVEKLEELSVAEGDWVTKDVANGKIELNPEGFPEKYDFISA